MLHVYMHSRGWAGQRELCCGWPHTALCMVPAISCRPAWLALITSAAHLAGVACAGCCGCVAAVRSQHQSTCQARPATTCIMMVDHHHGSGCAPWMMPTVMSTLKRCGRQRSSLTRMHRPMRVAMLQCATVGVKLTLHAGETQQIGMKASNVDAHVR
jgi:hypothetical protein